MPTLPVPITKGKGTVEIDPALLPDSVYRYAMIQGLKVLANRGMTKITKGGYASEDEYHAAAMAKAAENVEAIMAGKIRMVGVTADKTSGKVMTEALRIARAMIKDQLKAKKVKVSLIAASEITKAAKALVAQSPDILDKAKAAIADREAEASKVANLVDVSSIPLDPARVKAAEEASKALSATQAGKVEKKSKPAS